MSTYSDAVLADTPVGYWRLGEASGNAADSSGNNITLQPYANSPTYGEAGALAGDADTCIKTGRDATPVSRSLYCEDNNTLDFGTGDFTIEFWLKIPSSIATDGHKTLCCKGSIGGRNEYRFGLDSSRRLNALVADDAGYTEGYVSSALAYDVWHHCVCTYDRDGNATGYVNGESAGTKAISARSGTVSNDQRFRIGYVTSGTDVMVWMDEVAVYSGLLSPTRIAAHYTAGTGASIPTILAAQQGSNINITWL